VASFEYVDDENEAAALEEAQAIENNSSVRNADRTSHWKDLLKDKYEVQQAEELSALGKRKRNGKQVRILFLIPPLQNRFMSFSTSVLIPAFVNITR